MMTEIQLIGEDDNLDILKPVVDISSIAEVLDDVVEEVNSRQECPIVPLKEIVREIISRFGEIDYNHEFRLDSEELAYLKVQIHFLHRSGFSESIFELTKIEALQYLSLVVAGKRNVLSDDSFENEFKELYLKKLISHGLDINVPCRKWLTIEDDDMTPLSQAAKGENIKLVKFLLNNGAIVTPAVLRAVFGSVSLSNANQVQIITHFLNSGVDLSIFDDRGGAIHKIWKAYYTVENFMWFLLERGLDPNIVDKEGRTALHYTAKSFAPQGLSWILIEHGADLYFKDKQGITPYDLILPSEKNLRESVPKCFARYQQKLQEREYVHIHEKISDNFKSGYHLEKSELKECVKSLYDAFESASEEISETQHIGEIVQIVAKTGKVSLGPVLAAILSKEYYLLSEISLYSKCSGEYIGKLHNSLLKSMPFISRLVGYTNEDRLEAKKQLAVFWNISESKVYDQEKMFLFDKLAYTENKINGTYDRNIFIALHEEYIDTLLAARQQELSSINTLSQISATPHQSIQIDEVESLQEASQNLDIVEEIPTASHQMKVVAPDEQVKASVSSRSESIRLLQEMLGVSDAEANSIIAAGSGGLAIDPILAALLSGEYALSGSSLVNVSSGEIVALLPATFVASMPFIVYLTDQNALERLDAKKQLAAYLGIPNSQVFDSEKVNLFDQLASGENSIDGTYDPRYFNQLHEQYIDGLIAAKQKELSASGLSAKIPSENSGLEEDEGLAFFKKEHGKGKDKAKVSGGGNKVNASAGGTPPDPDEDPDDEKYKGYERFKKKDGSKRYECEKTESPEWKKSQNFKDGYRTNGLRGKEREYYRWDDGHKDIEIYDRKGRYIGSKDPVSGKVYRQGTMRPSSPIKRLL